MSGGSGLLIKSLNSFSFSFNLLSTELTLLLFKTFNLFIIFSIILRLLCNKLKFTLFTLLKYSTLISSSKICLTSPNCSCLKLENAP